MNDLISRSALLEKAGWFNLYKPNTSVHAVRTVDIHKAPAVDAVPMDFHERCLELEVKKRIAAEKTARQCIENYEPVRHGRWVLEIYSYSTPKCSCCGWKMPYSEDSTLDARNYCPNCGAKMDAEVEE